MTGEHQTPWDLVKTALEKKVSAESYENWISRTQFAGMDGKTLLVSVPDATCLSILREEFSTRILDVARASGLGLSGVRFSLRGEDNTAPMPGRADNPPDIESPLALNPKFTF
ncbi:MAG TPA: DnaA N-terminal domain-containing protein, partial [Bryobacteraceae bacterium]|nr:DnaA N-terminal domain-containing protein [Bryobacteraceae bacterium]